MSWYDIERLFDSNREHQIMCIRKCWMTLLEIKERISEYKKETSGKESYNYEPEKASSAVAWPAVAWPLPVSKQEGSKNES